MIQSARRRAVHAVGRACVLLGAGLFLTLRPASCRSAGSARRGARVRRGARDRGDRRADAVPGVHDRAGGVDRHRQHRRRGDGDRLGRARRAVLDLGATASSRRRSSSREAVLGMTFRETRGGDGAVRARCTTCATACDRRRSPGLFALVAGRRRADDDAVHAAELDRARREQRRSACRSSCPASSIAVLTWLVIIGGIKSIGRAAEKLAPLKVGLYLAGGLIVICRQRRAHSRGARAGRPRGVLDAGGRRRRFGMFIAMRYGIARGIYANEAGYGTAAVAYGTAQSAQPVAAGAERGDGGVHRLVRDLDDQRDDDPADRRLAVGPDEHAPRSPPASTPSMPTSAARSSRSACSSSATPR